MKRVCVFAHYDRDNIIDDYVIYYLNALKDVAETIIFVSDCDLEQKETAKLNGIADYIIAQKHGEYDFGSYKRGFLLAKDKGLEFDELIFANDSVYGPFYPLKPIFEKMEKKKCDWWGMTKNSYGMKEQKLVYKPKWEPHIQSYFIVFSKKVFTNDVFEAFMLKIKHENKKEDIITKYEVGLSKYLNKNGFKSSVYIDRYWFVHNCMSVKWDEMIKKYNFPFLKTTIIKNGFYFMGEVIGWEDVIRNSSAYPIELINKNSQRLKDLYENKYSKLNLYRKIRFRMLIHCPPEIRYLIILFEKYTFIVLNTICFHKLKKF